MKVLIVNKSQHPLPQYQSNQAACVDLTANLAESITLKSLERALVPTGIFMAMPEGYEAQIRPRSGLAAKHGISIVNAPGTIDADYRGEVKVLLVNLSSEEYIINDGERIAQMIITKYEPIEWQEVESLDQTARGEGSFGHTGK